MSKRRYSTQCKGKLRYDSEDDARLGMIEHHGKGQHFNVYWCPHCEFWHVGHRDAA